MILPNSPPNYPAQTSKSNVSVSGRRNGGLLQERAEIRARAAFALGRVDAAGALVEGRSRLLAGPKRHPGLRLQQRTAHQSAGPRARRRLPASGDPAATAGLNEPVFVCQRIIHACQRRIVNNDNNYNYNYRVNCTFESKLDSDLVSRNRELTIAIGFK